MKLKVHQGNLNSATADEKPFGICIRQIPDPHQRTQFKGILQSFSFLNIYLARKSLTIKSTRGQRSQRTLSRQLLLRLPSFYSHLVRCQRAKGYQSLSKDFPSPAKSHDMALSTNFDKMQFFFCRKKAEPSPKVLRRRYFILIKSCESMADFRGKSTVPISKPC